MTDTSTPPPRPSAFKEAGEIALTLVVALLVATLLRILLFQPFTIPSLSLIHI